MTSYVQSAISFFVIMFTVFHGYKGQELAEYFPSVKGDLTKVTWAHAVNSKEKLKEALQSDALMIEADVVLGFTSKEARDKNEAKLPVMAHPPEVVSDLTLEEFLHEFEQSRVEKGIKLDFKSREAFAYSETILDQLVTSIHRVFPVFLNADILSGPVNATATPVDAGYFLSVCVARFPFATLSLGWTTSLEKGSKKGQYTQDNIDAMTNALNANMVVTIPVTFAVRAAFAARSVDLLTNLVGSSSSPSTTLTIWSSNPDDYVDINGLQKLINQVGKDRVYLDLPESMLKSLESGVQPSGSSSPKVSTATLIVALTTLLSLFL